MGVLRAIGEEDVMPPQIASACFHSEEVYSVQKCLAQVFQRAAASAPVEKWRGQTSWQQRSLALMLSKAQGIAAALLAGRAIAE